MLEFNEAVQYRQVDSGWGMSWLFILFIVLSLAISYLGKTIYALRHPTSTYN